MPWTLLASAAIGVWLMGAPSLLGAGAAAADSDHLVGALVVCVAVIATAEVGRALRLLNIVLGLWLVVSPWLLDGTTAASIASDTLAGIALMILSLPRGRVVETYGGAERFIR